MTLSGLKLITFDATNTLLKFRQPPWDYYAIVAKKYGFKGQGQELKQEFKKSYNNLMRIHPNFGKESIKWETWWEQIISRTFREKLGLHEINKISKQLIKDFTSTKCWEKANGSDELLKLLRKNRIALGVISNFDPRLHTTLHNLDLNYYFEFILTSYEVGFSKPDKELFKIAQNKIGTKICSSQCLHIGDDLDKDYKGARNAGWNAILVTEKTSVIECHETVKRFKNLFDLYKAIENQTLWL